MIENHKSMLHVSLAGVPKPVSQNTPQHVMLGSRCEQNGRCEDPNLITIATRRIAPSANDNDVAVPVQINKSLLADGCTCCVHLIRN
jgi:hypothetical protein